MDMGGGGGVYHTHKFAYAPVMALKVMQGSAQCDSGRSQKTQVFTAYTVHTACNEWDMPRGSHVTASISTHIMNSPRGEHDITCISKC